MAETLVVIERPSGRETRHLGFGERAEIVSDGPMAVTVYGGEMDD